MYWPPPTRSNREVSADWFRVLGSHLLDVLTNDVRDGQDPTEREVHIVYCIHYLGQQCDSIKPDPREEAWLRCPFWFEAWEGEGAPPYQSPNTQWVADAITDEVLENLGEPLKAGFEITWDSQPCRLCVRDSYASNRCSYFNLDQVRGVWFQHHLAGNAMVRVLEEALRSEPANVRRQTISASSDLAQIDYRRLAEDLTLLQSVLVDTVLGTAEGPAREDCSASIDRLWIRLNDGRINRIDVSQDERDWLLVVWEDVLWAWRFFEMTRFDPRALWDLYSDRHAVFVPAFKDLRFDEHIAKALKLTGQPEDVGPAASPNRWRSSNAGYSDGLTILQVVTLECQKDSRLQGLSERAWARRLHCSRSGAREALQNLLGRLPAPRRERPMDLDDFAIQGGRNDLLEDD
ncbi:hypothetical protein MalM25_15700 [Planctomycetes bacterium MalM25]|nr:hypothetical protein MalM25_15700 [Planctomycetes bacterium MalM25]